MYSKPAMDAYSMLPLFCCIAALVALQAICQILRASDHAHHSFQRSRHIESGLSY